MERARGLAGESLKYMVWHTNYGSDEKSRSWLQQDDAMRKYLKNYEYYFPSGERIIVEVLEVGDPKYKDGIMYTFRCLSTDDKTLFALENSQVDFALSVNRHHDYFRASTFSHHLPRNNVRVVFHGGQHDFITSL